MLARYGPSSPTDFVLPFLKAGADYAQFPTGLTWAELARLPAYRAKWLALLPKKESATTLVNKSLKAVAALTSIEKVMTTHTALHPLY